MMSPIALFVYKRLDHTKQVIEALQHCEGATESKLFIFSDAGRNAEEQKEVDVLRDYLATIDGFEEVKIISRAENKGLAFNIIEGISEVVNTYGRVIVLEDDIICAPNVLRYMNGALEKYEQHEDIFSISAYHPQLGETHHTGDFVYKNYRNSSWGWATWANRWNKVDWQVSDHKEFFVNKKRKAAFNRGGEDLSWMLWKQQYGKIDSWAIRFCYAQHKHNAYTLFPVQSLVSNIGFDGSGRHSEVTNKYAVNLGQHQEEIRLPDQPVVNERIMKEFRKYYKLPIKKKVKKLILMDLLNGWDR